MWQVQGNMGKTEPCALPHPCLQFICNISEGEMKDKRQKSAQVMRIHKDSWTCSSCESCYLTSWTRLLITGFNNHEVDTSGAPRSDCDNHYTLRSHGLALWICYIDQPCPLVAALTWLQKNLDLGRVRKEILRIPSVQGQLTQVKFS